MRRIAGKATTATVAAAAAAATTTIAAATAANDAAAAAAAAAVLFFIPLGPVPHAVHEDVALVAHGTLQVTSENKLRRSSTWHGTGRNIISYQPIPQEYSRNKIKRAIDKKGVPGSVLFFSCRRAGLLLLVLYPILCKLGTFDDGKKNNSTIDKTVI